jgi:tripartite-type tricarboxylate transporter receptor subunit TctC
MKKFLLIVAAAGAALFSPTLRADDYPSKPITLVLPRTRGRRSSAFSAR